MILSLIQWKRIYYDIGTRLLGFFHIRNIISSFNNTGIKKTGSLTFYGIQENAILLKVFYIYKFFCITLHSLAKFH